MESTSFLPYGRQCVDADDVAAVTEVLGSDWLTGGPAVDRFEAAFADAVGAPRAVACSSGTAGLHLAALALNVRAGDVVVVPSITFLASANAFRFEGATIVFADVDPVSGLMTAETCAAAIERGGHRNVRAIVPVHLGGRVASPSAISAVAKKYGAAIVEDACHALGTTYSDTSNLERRVGACLESDMAVFSLHPVKTATMGEGGVVTARNGDDAQRMSLLRSHGMERRPEHFTNRALGLDTNGKANPWYYEMHDLAPNYRASDIHCALGSSQLAKLPAFAARRRELARLYDGALKSLAPVVSSAAVVPNCDPVLHLYSIRIDFAAAGIDRATLMARLAARGIGTQVHYIPVHLQPYYRALSPDLSLPGAEAYYASTLSVPFFPTMTDGDVDRVVGALAASLEIRR
jgi:UDP-4-amino-4,6-dideoxy-N-acetyl-beta-L-altrosamine transaminase